MKFKNFQSFLEEQRVTFELPKGASFSGYERTTADGSRLSTVLAAFGANASGKTALLKTAAFLFWFMKSSFSLDVDAEIPLPPRLLSPDDPSEFELIFDDGNGDTWKYELKLTEKRVLWEALYRKQVRFNYQFKRAWDEETKSYDVQLRSFDLPSTLAKKVRENASLVSTARQYNSKSVSAIERYRAHFNVDVSGRPHYTKNLEYANLMYKAGSPIRDEAMKILRAWDLGLESVDVIEESRTDTAGHSQVELKSKFVHLRADGSTFVLPFEVESNGTQSAYVLLAILIPILQSGGIAIIDEMESDLHPHLLDSLLQLFNSEVSNPYGAQLFFSSHTTKVLDYLGKAQTYFVEKVDCVSTAFRGDQVQGLRSDDNLRAKYESGAIGALPEVRSDV
ncbi:TPA: ATP/GTP-binding protein [Stenotrophomonas maltophilia]|uniref:ATP-binding protein n=1 Tax=Stenotrophomonas maltophilia TaxID=40324 RepID=A0AAI9CIA3_STEMA|nr:ATP-binding protein [Stenotrophomonas maltophilia]EKZ1925773.1 ATP-binding protein [Stenotrophomonas maltophilia]EMB2744810.1 ATP-binding protein [Stenotrophomonas maltophilia]MBH1684894.1 ATP-binding protein [Stenotrophomonas maltophilia]MBH1815068.1 ATP-binding protein [Stenotrophomonas maltophilia]MBH1821798.1 ATP-binding protein [Stenotrophomonas maltophilia]